MAFVVVAIVVSSSGCGTVVSGSHWPFCEAGREEWGEGGRLSTAITTTTMTDIPTSDTTAKYEVEREVV